MASRDRKLERTGGKGTVRGGCSASNNCSAPLCPLDEESLRYGVWYPGEEICRRFRYQFIKTQKKIQRALSPEDDGLEYGYFTFRMLERNMRVTRSIRGLDPERDERSQLARWEKAHPHRTRTMSEEKKRELVARLRGGGMQGKNEAERSV